MHELGIAHDLFDILNKKAKENNLKKITKVRIKVGVASGVEKDFLRHSFVDHIFPNTIAEAAVLEITDDPIEVVCKDCKKKIEQQHFVINCPHCGSYNIEINSGDRVFIESIEGEH